MSQASTLSPSAIAPHRIALLFSTIIPNQAAVVRLRNNDCRVLYLQPCASFGGAERQASIVIPRLAAYGMHVLPLVGPNACICRWLEEQEVTATIRTDHFPGGWVKPRGFARVSLLYRYWRCHRAMARLVGELIDAHAIDVVVAAMPFSWIAATKPARARGVPIVWRAGGTSIRGVHKPLLRMLSLLRPPDVLLCCSNAVREVYGPLIASRHQVVRNGVELDRFQPEHGASMRFRPEGAQLVIGFAARLSPEKRAGDFIAMASHIAHTNAGVHFLVAGDGSRRVDYEAQVRQLGLAGRVHFLGFVADMPAFYASCDIMTLPSESEGCSNMMLEAMAMQRALVVSEVVARTGEIQDGRDCLTHPVGDVDRLASQVQRLIDSASERDAMSRRALNTVRREFDVQHSARHIAAALARLVPARNTNGVARHETEKARVAEESRSATPIGAQCRREFPRLTTTGRVTVPSVLPRAAAPLDT
jgi:glycosyltransferase involved in cell wall biosynthesis